MKKKKKKNLRDSSSNRCGWITERNASGFDVTDSAVSHWKKRRTKIEQFSVMMITRGMCLNRKTIKLTINEALEDALFTWLFKQQRDLGISVTSENCKDFREQLQRTCTTTETFIANNGMVCKPQYRISRIRMYLYYSWSSAIGCCLVLV